MATAGAKPIRFRADVEYDGAGYQGFQRQLPEQPTIQGALERALQRVAGQFVTITGAGRTDSGVHARGQVVSFDLAWVHEIGALKRALNANLPPDVVVRRLDQAAANFHPRFDAICRRYAYTIYNAPVRSPLRHRQSWHVRYPLDISVMNQAAAHLLGEQDFATFGKAPQGSNTVRRIFQAQWRRREDYLRFKIEANAYLYRMVRSLVGSLRMVGDGRWQVSDFRDALQATDRARAGSLAPAQGLCLVAVEYAE